MLMRHALMSMVVFVLESSPILASIGLGGTGDEQRTT